MNTFVFQPGMTWRKLGFALYSNSTSYREVLEQNPNWSVMELPPAGAALKGSPSRSPSNGASQQPSVFSAPNAQSSSDFFPFDSQSDYYAALAKYNPSSLRSLQKVNGITSDSSQARTGVQ